MAYENLKQEIQDNIKTNGEGAITGQILQDTLLDMVTTISKGYTLFTDTIQDRNNLPPAPTDGGKYFLLADYISGRRKYRYFFFSEPERDNGQWYSNGTFFRIDLGLTEQSSVGSTPITMSSTAVEEAIAKSKQSLFLDYTMSGYGETWEDFIAATEPNNQESGDWERIAEIGNAANNNNVSICVRNHSDGIYFLTIISPSDQDDFALYFGVPGDGYIFTFSANNYEIEEW
jgi:hypothetical protein